MNTHDAVRLRAVFWPGAGRGTVLLLQGRTEYIEKAQEVIAELRARGFAVLALDWRGQGLSQRPLDDPRKGHVTDLAAFQIDIDAVLDEFADSVSAPLIIGAHSMGGAALMRFLARRSTDVHCAFATAPMLGLHMNAIAAFGSRVTASLMVAFGRGERYVVACDRKTVAERGFADNPLTCDRARFDRHALMLSTHPDLALGGVTWAWLDAAFREMALLASLPGPSISTPTLLIAADGDTVVSNEAIAAAARRHSALETVTVTGSLHEPMMESDAVQAQVWAALDDFFDRVGF